MEEKIYEVDILYVGKCSRGAAIISDKGITIKNDLGKILICFDTVNIKRDDCNFKTMNDENRAMTEDQAKEFWSLNINIVSKMIKRGVFSINCFNYSIDAFCRGIGIADKDIESGFDIPESACPHYEG